MTTKLEQAARALLAHWDTPSWKYLKPTGDLMADLREALAEPQVDWKEEAMRLGGLNAQHVGELRKLKSEQAEQEPVAWYSVKGGFNTCGEGKPLYAAPVRTKELTDDEIDACFLHTNSYGMNHFARAVIAADREKNK